MHPDHIDHIFFRIQDNRNMSTNNEKLIQGVKGFIIGSIGHYNDVTISSSPVVHKTKPAAIKEATRLVQTGNIPPERSAIVLEVVNYIKINRDPVIIT